MPWAFKSNILSRLIPSFKSPPPPPPPLPPPQSHKRRDSTDPEERHWKRMKKDSRDRIPEPAPKTADIFEHFRQVRGSCCSKDQMVGLCAYLDTILKWGYRIDATDYDDFILRYPEYTTTVSEFAATSDQTALVPVPSYHKWFQGVVSEHKDITATSFNAAQLSIEVHPVLSQTKLRHVAEENPYAFLLVRFALESMLSRASKGVGRRTVMRRLRQLEARFVAISDAT
ncbi:hypothetical protein PV08_07188 [Exophiala spinifera]|uniref:Uncharacterized protein n=1 Tax=Exophiala spinifera TaxID=91928 RepID=A0A0D1YHK7_9EURO|nr:uncharacterized protein PV08_07188 [Exophiala spinifera]KIW14406.1 hypothetical protein PV08_07188 [Exophiala spinifera]